MREIKFRAWDKKGRFDMADVSVVDTTEKYIVVADGFQWNIDKETQESECVAKFDEIELMQYTGLKDKNGKEIYEGDICKCPAVKRPRVVEWRDGRYWLGDTLIIVSSMECMFIEVIGNIYENPELINNG